MDFVVSKVAMVTCALLVLTILRGTVGTDVRTSVSEALEDILDGLCSLADGIMSAGGECETIWTVPPLPSGESIMITLEHGTLRGECEDHEVIRAPTALIRTWSYGGGSLNDSMMEELDAHSIPIRATTGHEIVISAELVLVNDEPVLLTFAAEGATLSSGGFS